ncbi:hypothetical protein, partial [Paramuribaculum intestinale]|uniref:hypothetical protein n=1 Tax=Paramuribaculum intestinale TaxID=2094151 RepID=UPI002634126C
NKFLITKKINRMNPTTTKVATLTKEQLNKRLAELQEALDSTTRTDVTEIINEMSHIHFYLERS